MERDVTEFFVGVDPERSAEEYLYVCDALRARGYVRYEISNFAKPGYESRHNRVYWQGGDYIGVGPGAHSYLDGERFYNEPSIDLYVSAGGRRPNVIRRAEPRRHAEQLIEERMLALRTAEGLAIDRVSCPDSVIDELVDDELADVVEDRLVLTDRGILLLNEILLRLTAGEQPHLVGH